MKTEIMIMGLLGAVAFKLINYHKFGKSNLNSPTTFDPVYWIKDRGNWNDMVLGAIFFYLIATYKETIFTAFADNFLVKFFAPMKDNGFFYFCIGLLMTFIIKVVRNGVTMVGNISKTTYKDKPQV